MYQVLGRISVSDAPIVFKGALITKLILAEHGYTTLERQTRDIDANWIGTPPPMGELENALNRSLAALDGQFHVEAFREYGNKMSAGFYIIENATGEKIVIMDIDVRPICGAVEGVEVSSKLLSKRWTTEITSRDKMFLEKKGVAFPY